MVVGWQVDRLAAKNKESDAVMTVGFSNPKETYIFTTVIAIQDKSYKLQPCLPMLRDLEQVSDSGRIQIRSNLNRPIARTNLAARMQHAKTQSESDHMDMHRVAALLAHDVTAPVSTRHLKRIMFTDEAEFRTWKETEALSCQRLTSREPPAVWQVRRETVCPHQMHLANQRLGSVISVATFVPFRILHQTVQASGPALLVKRQMLHLHGRQSHEVRRWIPSCGLRAIFRRHERHCGLIWV